MVVHQGGVRPGGVIVGGVDLERGGGAAPWSVRSDRACHASIIEGPHLILVRVFTFAVAEE